ncbi:hypothetical protein IC232_03755 [Microvirga sp. BT688]|uniref:hypothetical protein n=1 Tax=Microvirga sp. TaxID=1873136 RepID=UPI00168759FE|nr:hypothetical protein [Microvirga sp.]MBD2745806.1 hypothetical protein [Microvirga sp.]
MATLKLTTFQAFPAEGPNGSPRTALSRAAGTIPYPDKAVEIKTADDAVRAFDEYCQEVTQNGLPAHAFASLKNGDRAPRGFKALKLDRYVNV